MSSKTSIEPSPLAYPCLFILGMHRGGTSCLTGMLAGHGLYIGDVKQEGVFNPMGNQEIPEVRAIDNRLLAEAGGSWYRPVNVTAPSPGLNLRIGALRRAMEKENRPWGIKDPRMLFCLEAWFRPGDRMVGVFRHPSASAASLQARNRQRPPHKQAPLKDKEWHELWFQYNSRLLQLQRRRRFPVVNFDWEPRRFCRAVALAARRLGLKEKGADFFQPALRHHFPVKDSHDAAPHHLELYRCLTAIAEAWEVKE